MCLNHYFCFAFQQMTVRMQPGVPGDSVLQPAKMEQERGVDKKLYRKHTAEYVMVNQLKRNHVTWKTAVTNIYILIKVCKIWYNHSQIFINTNFFSIYFSTIGVGANDANWNSKFFIGLLHIHA